MEKLRKFTYPVYEEFLTLLKTKYPIVQVRDTHQTEPPQLMLTHGIDWSLESAYKMAEIENNLDIKSSYFVLFANKLYNVLERDNISRLQKIVSLGHEIGLHYDMKAYRSYGGDPNEILEREVELLQSLIGEEVKSICMHQPAIEEGDPFINHPKYINAANPELFNLYVVESYRAWGREYLEQLLAFKHDKVRLSIHPGLWGHVETNREGAITKILDAVDRENRDECVRLFNYHWYPHPKVLQYDAEASSEEDVNQTVSSFADKWRHILYKDYGERECERKAYEEQFCAILGVENMDELNGLLKDGMNVLNAGCGIAWPEHRFNLNRNVNRYAIDINESAVTISKEFTEDMDNVFITREDLFNLSFEKEFFDIIFAHGVVHHTGDARKAFRVLCEHLKPRGLIGIYVYCVKPFIRELIDREIRELTTNMSIRECDEFSKQITEFGCSLKEIKEPLRIHNDIPLLNIMAGTYDLQPFIYDHFIKCFYNENFGFDYSTIVNIDWYHPKCVTYHTREEIEFWFKENHIEDVKFIQPPGWKHSGYFVSGRKVQSF